MEFFSTAILSVIFAAGLDVTFTADRVAILLLALVLFLLPALV
jgi:hypothetical protein